MFEQQRYNVDSTFTKVAVDREEEGEGERRDRVREREIERDWEKIER
jgi:hypothetical protein